MVLNVELKIKELLGMSENEVVIILFILGYLDVKYKRIVNRNIVKFEVR